MHDKYLKINENTYEWGARIREKPEEILFTSRSHKLRQRVEEKSEEKLEEEHGDEGG